MTNLEMLLKRTQPQMIDSRLIYEMTSDKGKLMALYLFNRLLDTKIQKMGEISKAELAVKLAAYLIG